MTGIEKRRTLLLFGLVVISVMIIAASLSHLELKPGLPMPNLEQGRVVIAPVETQSYQSITVNRFVLILFGLIILISILYSLFQLLRGAGWKQVTSIFWKVMFTSLVISAVLFIFLLIPKSEGVADAPLLLPTPAPEIRTPLGNPPPSLLWLVGLGLLVCGGLIAYWIIRENSKKGSTLDMLGLEAQKAYQDLQTGLGLKDVIIRCYQQMSLALAEEQGLERQENMTTREFERLLEAEGLPGEPIHQLTQLFEVVRYGNWQPNTNDEQKAIRSLQAIITYSLAKGKPK